MKIAFFTHSLIIVPDTMKSLSKAALILVAGLSGAVSFHAPSPPLRRHASRPPGAELSPIDEARLEDAAEFCLHESCEVDEYESLIDQLEEQREYFVEHVANVESLLNRLKDSNHPEHDPDEVSRLVGNIKDALVNFPAATKGSD